MIQWFKDGKALPKRYVWEIVLGAHAHFVSEQSLVDIPLEDGVTCDVIGDVHGMFYFLYHSSLFVSLLRPHANTVLFRAQVNSTMYFIFSS